MKWCFSLHHTYVSIGDTSCLFSSVHSGKLLFGCGNRIALLVTIEISVTTKEVTMTLMFSGKCTPANRLAMTLNALCDFLDDPHCRGCEVLELCFKRLQTDASARRSEMPRDVLQKLRQTVPFTASPRRCNGQRCLPAEMLMVYLTRTSEAAGAMTTIAQDHSPTP